MKIERLKLCISSFRVKVALEVIKRQIDFARGRVEIPKMEISNESNCLMFFIDSEVNKLTLYLKR